MRTQVSGTKNSYSYLLVRFLGSYLESYMPFIFSPCSLGIFPGEGMTHFWPKKTLCSGMDTWPKPRSSEPMIIYPWTFAKIKVECAELWQCKPRTVGSHLCIVYRDLAGNGANINKHWEMKRETVSPDENFKSLCPAMPKTFYFELLNFMNLFIPLLLSSSFYFNFYNLLENELQLSLFKEGRQHNIINVRIYYLRKR